MIGKLTGAFIGVVPDGALIEVEGVGYAVRVPALALANMQKEKQVSLFIHTAVREDAIDLYGFPTQDELIFFKQLLSVSGIGPKSALGILNVADVETLKHSIAAGDNSMLTKVFGIGKKSAERIVVELRDKLALESSAKGEKIAVGTDGEVVEALMALGYSAAESRSAVKEIPKEIKGVKERIAASLRYLGTGLQS
ncbi:MAG TPA: Holliday junction branch migration protein RuvA [Candidatus Paceibacterota bacterium]|nr:Holliday junction branch migration protein RuvA [Candidatus Paceibacterota bacterium]